MRCPCDSSTKSKVIDSREADVGIRRRRECLECGRRFTTYERIESAANLVVIKKDLRPEAFSRDKLAAGIRKSLEKRPLPTGTLERIVDDIENELQSTGRVEVRSSQIGEMVMERLREIDHVAFIRFASVYRDFKDIDELRRELEALESGPNRPWLNLLAPQPSLIPQDDLESLERDPPKRRRSRIRVVAP